MYFWHAIVHLIIGFPRCRDRWEGKTFIVELWCPTCGRTRVLSRTELTNVEG